MYFFNGIHAFAIPLRRCQKRRSDNPMPQRNQVKEGIASGSRVRGIHLTFAQPAVIESLALVGLQFIYIDGEHGCFDWRDIEAACITAERHGITPIARVPDRTAATITGFLDRGIQGLVVPHVDSLADAQEVIDAAYFAPLGNRSFGGGRPKFVLGIDDMPAHLAACNAALSLCIMIESQGGLDAAGDMAALPGVDYLSFGLNDLAQSLGHAGQPKQPAVQAAVAEATKRIRAAGKPVREDFMNFAWINEVLVTGARQLLGD
jgi:4-hydroxy-2-oxoheptanedioate aldolase